MERILIIDDDLDICTLLHRFLTRKGYEVLSVNSGQLRVLDPLQRGGEAFQYTRDRAA